MKYSLVVLTALIMALANPAPAQSTVVPLEKPNSYSLSSTASTGAGSSLHERNPRYRLRKGDTFDLDFALSPEFNQTVAIQPDGYVTLKGVGSFFVEGQTVPELTETVKAAYAKTLHDPVIAIALKDFEKPYFIASGQVTKPGKYDLRSDLTVTEAVAIAGGFNDKAKHSQVVLFRPVPSGGYEAKLLNIKKLLASRNLSEDVQVQPGDMLYVPQNAFSKIKPFIPTANMGAYYNPAAY
ncbi:MAG: polysaccharide export protein [Formivibrio sp.]|nr:polysaccharide export protein [Formivibrio sp.]